MQNLFSLIKNFKEFVKDEREASKKMFKKKDPSYTSSSHFFKIKGGVVQIFVLMQPLRIGEGVSSHEDIQLAV